MFAETKTTDAGRSEKRGLRERNLPKIEKKKFFLVNSLVLSFLWRGGRTNGQQWRIRLEELADFFASGFFG